MMNYDDVISNYFKAWEKKDSQLHKSLFLKEIIAIRTSKKSLVFTIDELVKQYETYDKVQFAIEDIEKENQEIVVKAVGEYVSGLIQDRLHILVKFVFEENLLVRAYETLYHPDITRIACIVTYDGSVFNGFQRQPGQATIQGEIEKGLFYLTKENITIHSSGRTDKGVHGLNQVFHFDTISQINPTDFYRVLNSYLPNTIHLKSSKEVSQTFHSRYDSLSKEYCYRLNLGDYNPIQRNYEWTPGVFDVEVFMDELKSIIGTHDFTSFTKTKEDKEMVRTIFDIRFEEKETYMNCYITGSGFLHFMVRYLIGTAIEIAKNKVELHLLDFIELKNSSEVKWKAPSTGLYLSKVKYNNF